jgi:hypothetical protein
LPPAAQQQPLFFQNPMVPLALSVPPTYDTHVPAAERHITKSLAQVILPAGLQEAWFFAFFVDGDFFAREYAERLGHARTIHVAGVSAETDARAAQATIRAGLASSSKVFVHSSSHLTTQFGSYHPKLLVLFYPAGVRVCVHTSNLDLAKYVPLAPRLTRLRAQHLVPTRAAVVPGLSSPLCRALNAGGQRGVWVGPG